MPDLNWSIVGRKDQWGAMFILYWTPIGFLNQVGLFLYLWDIGKFRVAGRFYKVIFVNIGRILLKRFVMWQEMTTMNMMTTKHDGKLKQLLWLPDLKIHVYIYIFVCVNLRKTILIWSDLYSIFMKKKVLLKFL